MPTDHQRRISPRPKWRHLSVTFLFVIVSLAFTAFSLCCFAVATGMTPKETYPPKLLVIDHYASDFQETIKIPIEHAITFAVLSAGASIAAIIVAVRAMNRRFILQAGEADVGLSA